MYKYLIAVILALAVALGVAVNSCKREQSEKERHESNVSVLMGKNREYKVRDSLNAVSVASLRLDKYELKQEIKKLLKSTNIKPSRVEYITNTVTETRDSIRLVVIRDSCFNYKDKWLTISGCLNSKVFVQSRDSLTSIIHREYKHRFLWWKWGTKGYRMEVINHNPNSVIKYADFVRVEQ